MSTHSIIITYIPTKLLDFSSSDVLDPLAVIRIPEHGDSLDSGYRLAIKLRTSFMHELRALAIASQDDLSAWTLLDDVIRQLSHRLRTISVAAGSCALVRGGILDALDRQVGWPNAGCKVGRQRRTDYGAHVAGFRSAAGEDQRDFFAWRAACEVVLRGRAEGSRE